MNRYDLLTQLYSPNVERLFKEIYGADALTKQQKRYRGAIRYFDEQPCWDFCTDLENIHIFRAPSRTERYAATIRIISTVKFWQPLSIRI